MKATAIVARVLWAAAVLYLLTFLDFDGLPHTEITPATKLPLHSLKAACLPLSFARHAMHISSALFKGSITKYHFISLNYFSVQYEEGMRAHIRLLPNGPLSSEFSEVNEIRPNVLSFDDNFSKVILFFYFRLLLFTSTSCLVFPMLSCSQLDHAGLNAVPVTIVKEISCSKLIAALPIQYVSLSL